MSEQVKFTEDELKKVKSIQESYFDVQNQFGQLKLARLRVEQQLDTIDNQEQELNKKFNDIQNDESSFLQETTKKYGEGNLDPDTGIFIPNNS
jgi:predicted nuclease with TOPRIM domain